MLKTLYLIMRPLLALAGAALDNTLVYWEAFYLTEILFKFRQLIRTFTMFGIGFIFVGTILYAYFNPATAQEKIKDVVIKSLIASVAVNMSRWIVAALIDISTILVVAIWALPLQIMGDTNVIKNIRFVQTHSYYDKVDTNESDASDKAYSTVYSCPAGWTPVFFMPCEFSPIQVEWETTLWLIPLKWVKSLETTIETTLSDWWQQSWKIWMSYDNIEKWYCVQDWSLVQYIPWTEINECEEWQKRRNAWRKAMNPPNDENWDPIAWWKFSCHSFSELTRLAANTSWPLYTLYGSIFALSNLPATTNYGNIWEVAIEMLMKIIVWFALVIPLLAFAVVMIIRVVVLRLVIAFSPILALGYVYEFDSITKIDGDKFTRQNVLNLLMMPVLWVFALSISIVFLSLLNNVDFVQSEVGAKKTQNWWKCFDDTATALIPWIESIDTPEWITDDNTVCYKFLWLQTVCLNEWERVSLWKVANTFTWLITNMLWVALMRMAVMAVLKTNKFTEWTVDFIDSTAKSIAKSRKIIPVPWLDGWAVSIWWAQQALSSLRRTIPANLANNAYKNSELKAFTDKTIANYSNVDEKVVADAQTRSEVWDTSFMRKPTGTNADAFNFNDRESRWIPKNMWTAIANNITKNRTQYPGVSDTDLETFWTKDFSSFEQLMSDPVFVNHATQNKYFDTFAKNRWGKSPKDQARASNLFTKSLAAQSTVYDDPTTDSDWLKTAWYFHNWRMTKVRKDPKSWIIDPSEWGIKSYEFPITGNTMPAVDAQFEDKKSIDNFMKIYKDEFSNDSARYKQIFEWGIVPYESFVDQLVAVDQDQQVIDITTTNWVIPVTVNTETDRADDWTESRRISSVFVWTEAATPTVPPTSTTPPSVPPVVPGS